uniref:Uncharacterized protein n=1 Tax=Glossina pallidipes TaxID=7398 RepID=A0A1A9ZCM9_GLOPL
MYPLNRIVPLNFFTAEPHCQCIELQRHMRTSSLSPLLAANNLIKRIIKDLRHTREKTRKSDCKKESITTPKAVLYYTGDVIDGENEDDDSYDGEEGEDDKESGDEKKHKSLGGNKKKPSPNECQEQ